jgi:RsiW-degrading membrane proteinase PrsW (M82 family)
MENQIIFYTLCGVLGVIPSLTWLSYYLAKDLHPEPKRMIIKIFFLGVIATIPTILIQLGLFELLKNSNIDGLASRLMYWFVIISLTEEILKYLVVRKWVLKSMHLDEPLDVMLYMVVSALGFAALENILYLFGFGIGMNASFDEIVGKTLVLTFVRFIGATFLHTLCSAVIGYAVAISLCDNVRRRLEAFSGIIVAVGLHGLYDFSIIELSGSQKFMVPIGIIVLLALITFVGFEKLKKLKGICKIN